MEATGTDDDGSAGAVPTPPRRHSSTARVWWVIGFVTVTTVGLAVLDWAVLMMHALSYGFTEALGWADLAPPDMNRHVWALVVGGLVHVGATAAMLWLVLGTRARLWPSWLDSLLAAAVGGAVGASALLLVLRISPLSLITS